MVKEGSGNYSYKWSGPNGFTATTETLTNLTVEGEYCVTVTDNVCVTNKETVACGYITCEECDLEAEFERDICQDGRIKLINYNVENTAFMLRWSNGVEGLTVSDENGDARDVSINLNMDPSTHEDLEYFASEGVPFYPNKAPRQVTQLKAGTFCGTVTDFKGCKDVGCVLVYDGNQCVYKLSPNLLSPYSTCQEQEDLPYNLAPQEIENVLGENQDFIGTCFKFDPCTDGGATARGPIIFEPNNPFESNPCQSGGTLKCSLCPSGDKLIMDMPPNGGIFVDNLDGEGCMCIFPPLSTFDPNFIYAANLGNISSPYDLPIVAFLNCDPNDTPLDNCYNGPQPPVIQNSD